ncbi:TPA: phosphotransferase RcsD [Klebsiella pneumoniae]|nr:phosphotransferase RcsD [Klebsiella pneumoniae]
MTPKKFSLIPGNISRFFILMVIVLLATMGVMIQSAVNAWLKEKSYQVVDVSHALHQRIDAWRYATWQIYDNIAATSVNTASGGLQETRLKQDVYYLEKPRRKTEALIFGSHDSSTLEMTQKMSDYLDILWGAETIPWSMYYLNGLDNSLILVSTLPLKDLSSSFKESTISSVVESRRAEMLLQANTLDERETFSPLRHLAWQNAHYFTLRTTFNQPGHLATVVAFDLPINDLIPPGMTIDSFRIEPDPSQNLATTPDKESADHIGITFNGMQIDIATDISTTGMQLLWTVPMSTMLLESMQNILLPLLLNIGLLALALFGFTTFRHYKGRSHSSGAGLPSAANSELRLLRAINEEIVSLLPLGLLVHDQEANRTVISNPIADHLLPHLNLQNITNMADQHQGVIQATVNNEQYEIRQYRSQVAPRTQILIIRDQDRDELVKLIDDIQLANLLESDAWKTNQTLFSVQELIDDVVPEVLPAMKRKGLQLLINNALPAGEQRYGDREALRRTLVLLIQYSVTTTPIGKITLDVCQDESASDRLTFRILDTGNGVSANEIDNMHFPYLNETQSDLYGKANALTFWLCDRMTRKLGGQLTIKARESLGTRYTLHLKMPASEEAPEAGEHLLDDVIVLLDVTSSEVRRIVTRQLESWGASCITPDDRATSQAFDLYLTDNPSNLTASGLLLSDDEVGIRKIGPGQLRVNFNISTAMQEAILQLIEQQLAEEAVQPVTSGNESNAELHASGYYALFADTVPDDVQRLYTEIEAGDFAALAQTAHRLKGAFAMLNLIPGKQLCETLEHLIREKDAQGIEKYISDIDAYVKSLL